MARNGPRHIQHVPVRFMASMMSTIHARLCPLEGQQGNSNNSRQILPECQNSRGSQIGPPGKLETSQTPGPQTQTTKGVERRLSRRLSVFHGICRHLPGTFSCRPTLQPTDTARREPWATPSIHDRGIAIWDGPVEGKVSPQGTSDMARLCPSL